MADSASESDSSSIDGGPIMMPPSPVTREQLQKRIESLQQQNRVLKVELETYKLRVKALQEENRGLRQASVIIVSLIHIGLRRELTVDVGCGGTRQNIICSGLMTKSGSPVNYLCTSSEVRNCHFEFNFSKQRPNRRRNLSATHCSKRYRP